MKICCDDMGYAVAVRVVSDASLGPAIKVKTKDDANAMFLPLKVCPWCGSTLRETEPTPAVTLYPQG